jgi:hypothetical protein
MSNPSPAGLSSLQICTCSVADEIARASGLFYVGPHLEHEGNRALWDEADESMEGAQLVADSPHAAVPAGIYFRQKAEREIHRVEFADGGNVVRYRGGRGAPPARRVERGPILEFTSKSRHALLTFMNSIDRSKIVAQRVWFLTLTYPAVWPADFKTWKLHLKKFVQRLERAYGHLGIVWKLEPQRRGAPHFHLLVLVSPEMCSGLCAVGEKRYNDRRVTIWEGGQLRSFRRFCSQAWYEVVASEDLKHLAAGVSCEPMEEWSKVVAYAGKYLGKGCDFVDVETGEMRQCGRFWAVRRRELWPIRIVTMTCSREDWIRARRVFRHYLEKKGRDLRGHTNGVPCFEWVGQPRPSSAFIPAEISKRVLEWASPWFGTQLPYHELWDLRRRVGVLN